MSITLNVTTWFIWIISFFAEMIETFVISGLLHCSAEILKGFSTYMCCGFPNICIYPLSLTAQTLALFCATPTGFCGQMPSQFLTGCYSFPICGVNQIFNIVSLVGLIAIPVTCFMHGCTSCFMNIPILSMCVFPCDIGTAWGSNCIIIPFNMAGIFYTAIMGMPNFFIQSCLNCSCESLICPGILGIGLYTNPEYCQICQLAGGGITQQTQQIGVAGCSSLSQMQNSLLMPPICISQVIFGGINTFTQQCMNPIIVFWNSLCGSISSFCGSSLSLANMGLGALNIITGPFT